MAHHFSHREPHWQAACYRHHQLPDTIKGWLFDQGSLTQKLVNRSGGQLRVKVLKQRIERARLSEYRALKLTYRSRVLVREVILYGQGVAWVYARTVIPLSTLKGPLRRLHYLGNRPLGRELFTDPTMRREGLELARVQQQHLPQPARDCQPVWGRRSLFWLQGKPLLVGEIFLEDLVK